MINSRRRSYASATLPPRPSDTALDIASKIVSNNGGDARTVVSAPRRFEHARLRVPDLGAATAFHTEVMGLVELGRSNGTVYLGAGLDTNYDLALVDGGAGVEHFALRADGDEQLEALERALNVAGVASER